jgi:hypothetical protein
MIRGPSRIGANGPQQEAIIAAGFCRRMLVGTRHPHVKQSFRREASSTPG